MLPIGRNSSSLVWLTGEERVVGGLKRRGCSRGPHRCEGTAHTDFAEVAHF